MGNSSLQLLFRYKVFLLVTCIKNLLSQLNCSIVLWKRLIEYDMLLNEWVLDKLTEYTFEIPFKLKYRSLKLCSSVY